MQIESFICRFVADNSSYNVRKASKSPGIYWLAYHWRFVFSLFLTQISALTLNDAIIFDMILRLISPKIKKENSNKRKKKKQDQFSFYLIVL